MIIQHISRFGWGKKKFSFRWTTDNRPVRERGYSSDSENL